MSLYVEKMDNSSNEIFKLSIIRICLKNACVSILFVTQMNNLKNSLFYWNG